METRSPDTDARIRPMSLADWAHLPDGERGEWVDGWLVEEEVASLLHDVIVGWLITDFGVWTRARGGLVVASETRHVVGERRGRKPDAAVFLEGQLPPGGPAVRVPPYIAVEVLSPSRRDVIRDRVHKVHDYAAFGVRYYWIVDPENQLLEIYELGEDGRYVLAAAWSQGEQEVPGCPGLRINLDAMWAHAARAR